MLATNRSAGRNVHIYTAKDPDTVLGGLILTSGITNANLYLMVEIICSIDSGIFLLQDEYSAVVQRDDSPLHPGKYYILKSGTVTLSDEPWLVRTASVFTGTRVAAFCDAVRNRDWRCIITGEIALNGHRSFWEGFEVAHIFPLAYEQHWTDYDHSRWITVPATSGGSINSVQNGVLLRADIYSLFNNYLISINPDDGYKIVCFWHDGKNIAGKHLDQQFRKDPHRPVDELLRWHFRQAVLANVRGAGEPVFEHDFPPGSDMMGKILSGPRAGEVMEFELFSRLAVGDKPKAASYQASEKHTRSAFEEERRITGHRQTEPLWKVSASQVDEEQGKISAE